MQYQIFRQFINAISTLTPQQRNSLNNALSNEKYSDRNPCYLVEQIEKNFGLHPQCPRCGSDNFKRWGMRSGHQRYQCRHCVRTYNALSGTPLARLRHSDQWQTYLEGMSHSLTLRPAAKECDITLKTSFLWRHRFLQVLENDQADELGDIVELDETFLRESFKGQREELSRPARKRGNDKKSSCRNIPVMVARDRRKQTVDGIMSNESATELVRLLRGKISIDAVVCADASLAHEAASRRLGFPLKELVTSAGQHVLEGIFHIQHVNAYHSHLKQWIYGVFHGVATKYLHHYLGWRRRLTDTISLTGMRLVALISAHWFKLPSSGT